MTPKIIYAVPYNGTLSPLHQTIAERRGIAHLHNEEMEKKYGWSPDGYPNWHDENGYNREYPLPYSPRYFYRFVDLFFRSGAESGIIDSLEQEFIGDEADAFYIEELLAKAEYLDLFTPGAAVVLYANSDTALIETWQPGQTVNSRWAFSFNTYYGSKSNKARRKLIRKWLRMKSKEDKPLAHQNCDQQTDPSTAGIIPFLVGKHPSIDMCDAAAKLLGLYVGNPPKTSGSCRIHALATGLTDSSKAKEVKDIEPFCNALAQRYSVIYKAGYSPQHYPERMPPKPNDGWNKWRMAVWTCANEWHPIPAEQ